jgi:hypothetical protein
MLHLLTFISKFFVKDKKTVGFQNGRFNGIADIDACKISKRKNTLTLIPEPFMLSDATQPQT